MISAQQACPGAAIPMPERGVGEGPEEADADDDARAWTCGHERQVFHGAAEPEGGAPRDHHGQDGERADEHRADAGDDEAVPDRLDVGRRR